MAVTIRRHKYEMIADAITQLIESGTFRPGDRLPSVRQSSLQHGATINTVLKAYYVLEAQGMIIAQPRSGFYVSTNLPVALPEPEISSPLPDPTRVSVRELVTMVLQDTRRPGLIQLGAAHPNPNLCPVKRLNRMVASAARQCDLAGIDYDVSLGSKTLRVQLAQRALIAGCRLSPGDILTTSGCAEAVNICLRAICRPGDNVALESPICFDTLQYLEMLGLRAVEIPTHPREGISLDALQVAIEQVPIRACIVISNFNNPLGSCLPDEKKRDLVRLLARHEIPLIENDIFGEIYFEKKRPLVAKAYDEKGLVLLCSSFSKTLVPGYRVGWVAAGRFQPAVEWFRYISSLSSPTILHEAVGEFLASGSYDPHLRTIRRTYANNLAALSRAVRRFFPTGTRLTRPAGGFVLWVQLPEQVDSLVLYRQALEAGIAITPGYLFSATDRYRNCIRLNGANWSDQNESAIHQLGQLIQNQC